MCLFNRDVPGMSCGHEECKNFYMLNKQMCMYGITHNSTNPQPKPTQNTLQKPIAQTIQPVAQKNSLSFNPPTQDLNVKRPRNTLGDLNGKDQEGSPTNKMVKTESDDKNEGSAQKMGGDQGKIQDANQFSQASSAMNAVGGDKNLLNNFILNNLLMSNPQASGNLKPEANMQKMANPLLLSLLQNGPGNFGLNSQVQPKQNTQQGGLNTMSFPQLFQQNMGVKTGAMNSGGAGNMGGSDPAASFGLTQDSMSPNNINTNTMNVANLLNDIKMKSENGMSGDSFLREFQGRILGLLFTQNKMLVDLKEKNDVLQDTLACLINEINNIKTNTKQVSKEKTSTIGSTTVVPAQFMGGNTETVSVEDLITFLYGPSPDFQYQLILKSDLPLPLYRERNFKFTVILTDKNGNVVENSNRIPLTIGLYSSENPPKYIDANTAGNKILKGFIEKDLTNGSATFEKIQIKEVTSHFRNGWIFFVVYPKVMANNPNSMLMSGTGTFINSTKIKPLILEKVVVKAKKAKEKEQTSELNEADDNPSVHNEENADESGK